MISRAIRTHFLTKAEEVEDAEENVEMNDMNPDVVSERIIDKTSNGRKTAYTLKYLGVWKWQVYLRMLGYDNSAKKKNR